MREPSRCVNRFADSRVYRFHPQALRGRHAIGALNQAGDLGPFDSAVEMDADPALVADIGRHEEAVGIGADQDGLAARRRLAPQRRPTVVAGMHGEDLVAHPEGRDLPGLLLDGFRQSEADAPQALFGYRTHASAISGSSGSNVPPASAIRTGAKERRGWMVAPTARRAAPSPA